MGLPLLQRGHLRAGKGSCRTGNENGRPAVRIFVRQRAAKPFGGAAAWLCGGGRRVGTAGGDRGRWRSSRIPVSPRSSRFLSPTMCSPLFADNSDPQPQLLKACMYRGAKPSAISPSFGVSLFATGSRRLPPCPAEFPCVSKTFFGGRDCAWVLPARTRWYRSRGRRKAPPPPPAAAPLGAAG